MFDLTCYPETISYIYIFLIEHLIFDWTQDSEVEALREDSFHLLAICSWSLSLAHFILLAKS